MTDSAAAGYSGTPLARKLGIRNGCQVLLVDNPPEYMELVSPLPPEVAFLARPTRTVDVAHVFVLQRARLARHLTKLRTALRPDAAVWVSWPKKASGVPTDITEDVIRSVALPMGFVDVKVCAVSHVWSGLKIVVRKELR